MLILFTGLSLVTVVDILLIALWPKKHDIETTDFQPKISILIAARNEEHTIGRCLDSLYQLDYPHDKIQILVGDDQSSDNTWQVAHQHLTNQGESEIVKITERINKLKGKANVLAQLARKATGDYLFITDADMQLPPSWVNAMLPAFSEGFVLVTGVTLVANHKLQSIDWLFALGMTKTLENVGIPVTAMGNNMAMSKATYDDLGGYESIPFSVTEDLELFKAVRQRGGKTKQLFSSEVLGWTLPIHSLIPLLKQRKRWMSGAVSLPWPVVFVLAMQAIYFPLLIFLFFIYWPLACLFIGLRVTVQLFYISLLQKRLKVRFSLPTLIIYQLYSWWLSLFTVLYYLLPVPIEWKDRKY